MESTLVSSSILNKVNRMDPIPNVDCRVVTYNSFWAKNTKINIKLEFILANFWMLTKWSFQKSIVNSSILQQVFRMDQITMDLIVYAKCARCGCFGTLGAELAPT